MERDALIADTIWQAAAESAGLPVYGRDWAMDRYDHACALYDRIFETSYVDVAAAMAQAVAAARP